MPTPLFKLKADCQPRRKRLPGFFSCKHIDHSSQYIQLFDPPKILLTESPMIFPLRCAMLGICKKRTWLEAKNVA